MEQSMGMDRKMGLEDLVITEVFDNNKGEYTEDSKKVVFTEGFLQGEANGRSRMAMELGLKLLEIFDVIEEETGMDVQELIHYKNREDFDCD